MSKNTQPNKQQEDIDIKMVPKNRFFAGNIFPSSPVHSSPRDEEAAEKRKKAKEALSFLSEIYQHDSGKGNTSTHDDSSQDIAPDVRNSRSKEDLDLLDDDLMFHMEL